MYAVSSTYQLKVDVYDAATWSPIREIIIPCSCPKYYGTHLLQVTDDRILLSCSDKRQLYVLSHSGELLQTHGRSGRRTTEDDIIGQTTSGRPVYGSCVLDSPTLCQVDNEGSALVVDEFNHRFLVMKTDGTWSVVDVNQDLNFLMGAVWRNGSLYVATYDKIVRLSSV